ncbi:hypothetical protein [Chryseobacterium sp. Alg-005]|uniref:hypothetical protein n=1 Tax=Chryseobacterium sp. Alg-005 TaxID=3159516 RepID=UPI0036F22E02
MTFNGNWIGTYSGTDHGTWKINISNSGNVTGSAHSNDYNEDFEISGNVNNNGQLNAVLGSSSSGGTFKGTLSGNSGNGTWSNNVGTPHSGSWNGNKQ